MICINKYKFLIWYDYIYISYTYPLYLESWHFSSGCQGRWRWHTGKCSYLRHLGTALAEHGPFTVDLPIDSMVMFHSYVTVYQRVTWYNKLVNRFIMVYTLYMFNWLGLTLYDTFDKTMWFAGAFNSAYLWGCSKIPTDRDLSFPSQMGLEFPKTEPISQSLGSIFTRRHDSNPFFVSS